MKTTVDLPDELVVEIKIEAARQRKKLRELVPELLRAGLSARRSAAAPEGEAMAKWLDEWVALGAALPPADEGRERAPFTFRVYRRGALTVVAWQEGELVCALVGGGDPEGVIALAMAKAMLPA